MGGRKKADRTSTENEAVASSIAFLPAQHIEATYSSASILGRLDLLNKPFLAHPCRCCPLTAFIVETLKSRIASSTCDSRTSERSWILAKDSLMRMMALS